MCAVCTKVFRKLRLVLGIFRYSSIALHVSGTTRDNVSENLISERGLVHRDSMLREAEKTEQAICQLATIPKWNLEHFRFA